MAFNSNIVRKQISRSTGGGVQTVVNTSEIGKVLIFIPPLPEQNKIASIISKVDELIQNTDQVIEQTQRLKKGLMQRLLTNGIGHTKFKKTVIREIPEEWEISTIEKECKVGTGGTPSRAVADYFNGDIPWIKSTEINFNLITSTGEHITRKALEESNAKMYRRGTLLMAIYGEGVTRGRSAILGIDAAINQACAAVQSLGRIDIKFLFYWCQMQYLSIRSKSHGTHQANLNLSFVKSLKIPIPSCDEQQKIAFIISSIDDCIQKHQTYKMLIDNIKKGLVQKLLTGKIRVKV